MYGGTQEYFWASQYLGKAYRETVKQPCKQCNVENGNLKEQEKKNVLDESFLFMQNPVEQSINTKKYSY